MEESLSDNWGSAKFGLQFRPMELDRFWWISKRDAQENLTHRHGIDFHLPHWPTDRLTDWLISPVHRMLASQSNYKSQNGFRLRIDVCSQVWGKIWFSLADQSSRGAATSTDGEERVIISEGEEEILAVSPVDIHIPWGIERNLLASSSEGGNLDSLRVSWFFPSF